jgi:hypothetical protein
MVKMITILGKSGILHQSEEDKTMKITKEQIIMLG